MAALAQRTTALEQAFKAFNEQSGALEASYRDLQQTVLSLSTRLENAQAARLAEFDKSERLGRHLADVLEQLSELRARRERLTEIGEMTAKFAHDVRTPLASAMLYTSQLDVASPGQRAVVDKLKARLDDVGRMVNDMLGFAAGWRAVERPCNVGELLVEIRHEFDAHCHREIDVRIEAGDAVLTVLANRDALKAAIRNLLTNAIQACGEKACIVIAATSDGDEAHITVSDNGPGIPGDVLPRIFEPFYTTRPQGTGLGLAVVRAVAEAHGGTVEVASGASGTRFTMRLPQKPGEAGDA